MKSTTKKNKTKNIVLTVISCVLVVILVFGLIYFNEKPVDVNTESKNDYHNVEYEGKHYSYNSSIISLLFMGIDSSNPEQLGQADTLDLILMNRDDETIKIISLSRDTMTDIHLYDVEHNSLGWDRQHLGLAYAYGDSHKNGAMLTSQAVSKLLFDVPVVHFAAMDLSKLSSVHEIVGELEVVVPNDSLVSVNPEWTQGSKIVLTKDNVETFLRTRDTQENYSNSDRMERQQAYMNAYMQKIKEMLSKNFDNTVSLVYNLSMSMTSNITLENVEAFSEMLLSYTYDSEKDFYTLKGKDQLGEFHDEFEVDQTSLKELVLELFYKEEK